MQAARNAPPHPEWSLSITANMSLRSCSLESNSTECSQHSVTEVAHARITTGAAGITSMISHKSVVSPCSDMITAPGTTDDGVVVKALQAYGLPPNAFTARTRNTYVVLGNRPVTVNLCARREGGFERLSHCTWVAGWARTYLTVSLWLRT